MASSSDGWVGGFRNPVPIRCRGGLHFYACADAADGRPRVVAMAPYMEPSEARARLSGLAHAHALAAGPHVPGVAAQSLDGPSPWVALECDAVADIEHVTDWVRHGHDKPPFAVTSVLGKTAMETLARCHRVRDPATGRPVCLGSLCAGNLLFAADGAMWIVGFGAGPLSGAIVAPEVASGGAASPGADLYALTLFLRSQMPFTRMPSIMRRVFSGQSLRNDAKLVVLLAWANLKILAGPAHKRPSMEDALVQAREMWRLLGFEPDVDGFRRWVAAALAAEPQRLEAAPPSGQPARVVVRRAGEWLEMPSGMRYALGRRGPLRRVLLALAEERVARPGSALGVDDLLAAGWPGERPLPEAGNNRVWVTVSTLRKLGLGEILQRWDGGYRLDPAVPCHLEDAPGERSHSAAE